MEGERWGLGNKKGRGHSSGKCDNRECTSWIKKRERESGKGRRIRGWGWGLTGEGCGGKQREAAGNEEKGMYTPPGQREGRDAGKCDKPKAARRPIKS